MYEYKRRSCPEEAPPGTAAATEPPAEPAPTEAPAPPAEPPTEAAAPTVEPPTEAETTAEAAAEAETKAEAEAAEAAAAEAVVSSSEQKTSKTNGTRLDTEASQLIVEEKHWKDKLQDINRERKRLEKKSVITDLSLVSREDRARDAADEIMGINQDKEIPKK